MPVSAAVRWRMVGLMLAAIIGNLYLHTARIDAILDLLLIASAFWVVTNYLSFLDRGR